MQQGRRCTAASNCDVIIEFGDNDQARETTVMIEGQGFGTISTAAGEFVEHTFRVAVDDGQATIELIGGVDGAAITSLNVFETNSWMFDFGPPVNPVVAPGYYLADTSAYNVDNPSFGWSDNDTKYVDYADISDPLDRDNAAIFDNRFFAELANGDYDVTVRMGDYTFPMVEIALGIQGGDLDLITTDPGELYVGNYTISVVNGLFTMSIKNTGFTQYGFVRSVEITPAAPPEGRNVGGGEGAIENDWRSEIAVLPRSFETPSMQRSYQDPVFAEVQWASQPELAGAIAVSHEESSRIPDQTDRSGNGNTVQAERLDKLFATGLDLGESDYGF